MRRVFVVSSSMTKVGRHFDKGLIDLAAEALWKAIDEVNIEPEAIIVGNMLSSSLQHQDNLGAYIASSIGFRLKPALKVEAACGSGGVAVYTAYALVASGLVKTAAVIGVEKMTDYPTAIVSKALAQAADAEYELFYGSSFTGLSALMMRYYMVKYNVSRRELSMWPVQMHEYALKNPYAQIKRRITVEDVESSPTIADPIKLLDSSPISDGAAALILASEDVVSKFGLKDDALVEIAGVGLAVDTVELSNRVELDIIPSAIEAARQAYKMAHLEPKDIDVVELHDAFTIHAMLLLEALGFSGRGEAAKLYATGRFRLGDQPVVNPSGGLKARGHPVGATGVYQVAEIHQQLKGIFPGVKVENAQTGLACNMGGDGASTSVIILRRVS